MDIPLPWERLLWSQRSLLRPWTRYALTDVRLTRTGGLSDELALSDVVDVQRIESRLDRLLGTSTLVVHARGGRRPPLVLRSVYRGIQVASLIELAGADPGPAWSPEVVRATLARAPRVRIAGLREALLSVVGLFATVFAVAVGLHGEAPAVAYPPDDAISPAGVKRDRVSIIRFMESEVMPWARLTLGPLVGGAEMVTCQTCHGRDAAARQWRMPAVSALPRPEVAVSGWETYGGIMDAQIRNAIYGYAAASDNHAKAAHMREAVMPGMASLLRRPAYDFTRSYEYNRAQAAFGCYHCHRVA